MTVTITWNIITGEYPLDRGGVADYSRLVARRLVEAGDSVVVWAPESASGDAVDSGIEVRRLPGNFGPRALGILTRSLAGNSEARILMQYVPHAFGFKGLNLFVCFWLLMHRRLNYSVMFHEVAYPVSRGQSLRHRFLGLVQRAMAAMVARGSSRIFVSTPAWAQLLEKLAPGREFECLPVPSNLPVVDDAAAIAASRRHYAPDGRPLIGHFGTYGALVAPMLEAVLQRIVGQLDCRVLLIGFGSSQFRARWSMSNPAAADRVIATGDCELGDASLNISACDLMVQPYPDGACTRRSSLMATLAHGRAVVSTRGVSTEALWRDRDAVMLVPCDDPDSMCAAVARMLGDEDLRNRYARAGYDLYGRQFDIAHTIEALRAHLADHGRTDAAHSRRASSPDRSHAGLEG